MATPLERTKNAQFHFDIVEREILINMRLYPYIKNHLGLLRYELEQLKQQLQKEEKEHED